MSQREPITTAPWRCPRCGDDDKAHICPSPAQPYACAAQKAHHCPEWDFLFIRPGDPEMECCTCT